MTRCSHCQGFVPPRSLRCPNCAAPRPTRGLLSRVGLAGGVLGGGAVAFTLMACYGMPPCDDPNGCGYVPPTSDAGGDASAEDAGDAGGDAAQVDAGGDSAIDAGSDGRVDAAVDASGDAEHDGGADAASPDAGDAAATDAGDAGTPADASLDAADAAG